MAQAKLGVQTRAIESHSAGDYIPNLASVARQGYDAVVAAGFLLADAEATVAKKFPNTQFAITDYPVEIPPFSDKKGKLLVKNITGITFKSEQQSYLVGCLSALMAKKGGGNTISATGGVKIPPVDSFIAGLQGRRGEVRPRARRCWSATRRTSSRRTSARRWPQNQIAAGSKVVFAVAGPCGFGALAAAKEAGVWGDGVDVDQAYLGPHILTSAVKRVDLGVFRFVQAVKDGTLVPGHDFVFDLKNGGVALGKISPKVPTAYKSQGSTRSRTRSSPARSRSRRPSRRSVDRHDGEAGRKARLPRERIAASWPTPPVLELRGITKQFPGVLANDHVDLDVARGRGACAARRERRRQVDADEHPLRALPPGLGRDPAQREEDVVRVGQGRDRERDRDGAPALHAHPGDDRGREHRPRRGAHVRRGDARLRRGAEARSRALRPLRPRGRPRQPHPGHHRRRSSSASRS